MSQRRILKLSLTSAALCALCASASSGSEPVDPRLPPMPDSPKVVTRFAPSPTGYLHVGGARTALFNWLLARHGGGTFYLRIEDTDLARSTDAAVDAVLEDMRWLGLDWDNADDLMFQSRRKDVYNKLFDDLTARGLAYEAWESKEELDNQRQQAQRAKRPYLYKRPTYTNEQLAAFRAEGRTPVMRFAMEPKDYYFDDVVLGPKQGVDKSQVQDFVIRKADGMPTYHFAVVVDDHAMGVTHVLRGQEHLLNTCQHIALMEALDYQRPTFAHLPVILKTDGSKMGKRDRDKLIKQATKDKLKVSGEAALAADSGIALDELKAWLTSDTMQLDPTDHDKLMPHVGLLPTDLPQISVHDFRKTGYFPETLNNFLALLGWSTGDDRERLSMDELVKEFTLDRVGRANAKFDYKKLQAFNTEAAEAASPERLLKGMRDYLSANPDSPLTAASDADLATILKMSAGFHVFAEVDAKARFFYADDAAIEYDPKAVDKFLKKGDPSGFANLRHLRETLAGVDDWTPEALETATKALCDDLGVGLGKVAQPARVAVSGTSVSPPIFDTLAFLGKDETLTRFDRCLALSA